jgi:hypothetical protein
MRKIIILVIIFAWITAWAEDDIISPSNFAPQAIAAKQIAPGASRPFSFASSFVLCSQKTDKGTNADYCETPHSKIERKKLESLNFRIDGNIYNITWPKTENTKGAENWGGHSFGGGLFLNAHYSFLLEIGVTPMLVQWIGPIYVAAAYQLSLGHYFGTDEKNSLDTKTSQNQFTGTFNLGGGAMGFMNNHGLGLGAHGGIRQIQVLNAGYKEYTATDYRTGNRINPESRDSYKIKEWIFYYGLDLLTYTNLPLLNESDSKWHCGFMTSIEMGIRTEKNPLTYWSLSLSLII